MTILLGVIALFALLSAIVAAGQALAISRLSPAASWRDWVFGWWRFDAIATRAGLSGEERAATYKRAVIACIVFLVLGLLLSGWASSQRQTGTAGLAYLKNFNDWQALPARFADTNLLRRVATMPGATMLES